MRLLYARAVGEKLQVIPKWKNKAAVCVRVKRIRAA